MHPEDLFKNTGLDKGTPFLIVFSVHVESEMNDGSTPDSFHIGLERELT